MDFLTITNKDGRVLLSLDISEDGVKFEHDPDALPELLEAARNFQAAQRGEVLKHTP